MTPAPRARIAPGGDTNCIFIIWYALYFFLHVLTQIRFCVCALTQFLVRPETPDPLLGLKPPRGEWSRVCRFCTALEVMSRGSLGTAPTLHLWALIFCAVTLRSSRFNGCLNSRMSCFTGSPRTHRQVVSPRRASPSSSSELKSQLSACAFLITTSCASTTRRHNALAALSEVCEPQVRIFERDENGARGCYFSHLSIYKEALEKKLPWALILEDNLILAQNPASSTVVRESIIGIVDRMSQSKNKEISDWSVLHLSLVHSAASLRLKPVEDGTKTILKVERTAPDWYGPVNIMRAPGLGTTAYIITRKGMQEMLRLDQGFESFERPIDDLLADTGLCMLCSKINCFKLFPISNVFWVKDYVQLIEISSTT